MSINLDEEHYIGKLGGTDFKIIRKEHSITMLLFPFINGVKHCFSFVLNHENVEMFANKLLKVADDAKKATNDADENGHPQ